MWRRSFGFFFRPSGASARLVPRCRHASNFMTDYQRHVAERALMGIAPQPLNAAHTSQVVSLLQDPPAEEGKELLQLLTQRVPPGVDEAAYVKAGFLAAISKGEATSPLICPIHAIELLGTMQGGYNIQPLIDALDVPELAPMAAGALSKTILVFDAFHDVEERANDGNWCAQYVMQSWADAEWFTSRPPVADKITVTVFKVPGETNTDDLSPAPDAWSRPDIPLHALSMLKNEGEVPPPPTLPPHSPSCVHCANDRACSNCRASMTHRRKLRQSWRRGSRLPMLVMS